ncbi:MAG: hypothetical protein N2490_05000 [Ignavibacteria bacterium]|nr:hypothetical protein [Ignavibacteria bacterium]
MKPTEIKTAEKKQKSLLISDMELWTTNMMEFGKEILKENIDYGFLPGIKKPILFKPGAEKLKKAFNLQVDTLECINEIFEKDGPYIDVTYRCVIKSEKGLKIGICEGSATSEEPIFKYRYKKTNLKPDKEQSIKLKKEGKGKWIKFNNKWVWCEKELNTEILGMKNIIKKVAQKRAFVGAVIMATSTSEFFSNIK